MDVVDELDENRLRVADQRDVHRIVAADAIRVDVELDERSARA